VNDDLARLLRDDPQARRCHEFATGTDTSIDALLGCYGAADDAAQSSPLGAPPSPSPAQEFERAYEELVALDGSRDAPSLDAREFVEVDVAELERLEAWAAWSPDRVYARFYGQAPLVAEEPEHASDDDRLYAQLSGGNR